MAKVLTKQPVVGQLDVLLERVKEWRKTPGKQKRIPEELWDAAVEVARVEGVAATSRATAFSYSKLQERTAPTQRRRSEAGRQTGAAAFVEISGPLGGGDKMVVEFVGQHGGRMRIDVSGTSRVDLVGLAQAFWRSES